MRSAVTSLTLAGHSCCKYRFRMQFINPALPAPHLALRQRVDPRSEVRRLVAYIEHCLARDLPVGSAFSMASSPHRCVSPRLRSAPVEALLALRQGTPAHIIAVEV